MEMLGNVGNEWEKRGKCVKLGENGGNEGKSCGKCAKSVKSARLARLEVVGKCGRRRESVGKAGFGAWARKYGEYFKRGWRRCHGR